MSSLILGSVRGQAGGHAVKDWTMRFFFSILISAAWAETCLPQKAADQKAVLDKMKAGWASYREKVDQHFSRGWNIEQRGEGSLTWRDPARNSENGPTSQNVAKFLNNGTGFVLIEEGKEMVHGGNPLYSFFLMKKRKPEKGEEDRLSLREFSLVKDKKQEYSSFMKKGATMFEQSKSRTFELPLYISGERLDGLPEPHGITWPSSVSIYPWIGGLLALLGLSVLLFWYVKGKNPRTVKVPAA